MQINKYCNKCGRNIHKDKNPKVTIEGEEMCKGCLQERREAEEKK